MVLLCHGISESGHGLVSVRHGIAVSVCRDMRACARAGVRVARGYLGTGVSYSGVGYPKVRGRGIAYPPLFHRHKILKPFDTVKQYSLCVDPIE